MREAMINKSPEFYFDLSVLWWDVRNRLKERLDFTTDPSERNALEFAIRTASMHLEWAKGKANSIGVGTGFLLDDVSTKG
jgi:hypothetical protein